MDRSFYKQKTWIAVGCGVLLAFGCLATWRTVVAPPGQGSVSAQALVAKNQQVDCGETAQAAQLAHQDWLPSVKPLAPERAAGQVVSVSTAKELAAALESPSGKVILLALGDYVLQQPIYLGGRDFYVMGSDPRRCIVRTTHPTSEVFNLQSCQNITISGLTIQGSATNGIKLETAKGVSSDVTFRACYFVNNLQRHIKIDSLKGPACRNITVDGCRFWNDQPRKVAATAADGDDLAGLDWMRVQGAVIKRCTFAGITGATHQAWGAMRFRQGCENIKVLGNIIVDCDAGIRFGDASSLPPSGTAHHCVNCTAQGNWVSHDRQGGIAVANTKGTTVQRNTIYTRQALHDRAIWLTGQNPEVVIEDNFVDSNKGWTIPESANTGGNIRQSDVALVDPAHGNLARRTSKPVAAQIRAVAISERGTAGDPPTGPSPEPPLSGLIQPENLEFAGSAILPQMRGKGYQRTGYSRGQLAYGQSHWWTDDHAYGAQYRAFELPAELTMAKRYDVAHECTPAGDWFDPNSPRTRSFVKSFRAAHMFGATPLASGHWVSLFADIYNVDQGNDPSLAIREVDGTVNGLITIKGELVHSLRVAKYITPYRDGFIVGADGMAGRGSASWGPAAYYIADVAKPDKAQCLLFYPMDGVAGQYTSVRPELVPNPSSAWQGICVIGDTLVAVGNIAPGTKENRDHGYGAPPKDACSRSKGFWTKRYIVKVAFFDLPALLANDGPKHVKPYALFDVSSAFWGGKCGRSGGIATDGRRILISQPDGVRIPNAPERTPLIHVWDIVSKK